jgi:hypothetical protein
MVALNRKQKIVLVALAAAIVVMQFLIFEEDGVRGYGWIISFVVVAGTLILLFQEKSASEVSTSTLPKVSSTGETGIFNDLIFELDRIYRRAVSVPVAEDATTKVIQRDMIFGAINTFAYGLLALKRSLASAGYLSQPEHGELLSMVVKRMVTTRSQIAGSIAVGIRLPGLDVSPDIEVIKAKVLQELQGALTAIADGNKLRPISNAETNLLQLFVSSAPYVKTNEEKENLLKAMSAFVAGYLR